MNESKIEHRKAALKAWRLANPEKVKAQNKRRYAKVKANPELYAKQCESRRRWTKLNWRYDHQKRDKQKIAARAAIRQRIWLGKLERQPCEVCGNPKSHAHHADYRDRLNVKWLCVKHHSELHQNK